MRKRKIGTIIGVTFGILLFLMVVIGTALFSYHEFFKVEIKEKIILELESELPSPKDFGKNLTDAQIEYYYENEKVELESLEEVKTYQVKVIKNENTYESSLEVIDKKAPNLRLKKITIQETDNYVASSFVDYCKDNSKKECQIMFAKEEDSVKQEIGEYEIEIIAKDESGNETKEKTTLNIIKKETAKPKQPTTTIIEKKEETPPSGATRINTTKDVKTEEKEYFGTKEITTTSTYFDVYSDGTLIKKEEQKEVTYDYSGYNATTKDIQEQLSLLMPALDDAMSIIVEYINYVRQENSLTLVNRDKELETAAMIRAIEIAFSNKFSSTRPNGGTYKDLLKELNYSYKVAGEILTSGYKDLDNALDAIKKNPTDYQNFIKEGYTNIGVGMMELDNTTYIVILLSGE